MLNMVHKTKANEFLPTYDRYFLCTIEATVSKDNSITLLTNKFQPQLVGRTPDTTRKYEPTVLKVIILKFFTASPLCNNIEEDLMKLASYMVRKVTTSLRGISVRFGAE